MLVKTSGTSSHLSTVWLTSSDINLGYYTHPYLHRDCLQFYSKFIMKDAVQPGQATRRGTRCSELCTKIFHTLSLSQCSKFFPLSFFNFLAISFIFPFYMLTSNLPGSSQIYELVFLLRVAHGDK